MLGKPSLFLDSRLAPNLGTWRGFGIWASIISIASELLLMRQVWTILLTQNASTEINYGLNADEASLVVRQ
jgi:hypothetical protein